MGVSQRISFCLNFLSHYVPALAKAAISHWLMLSPTASVWDLRTTLLVALIRSSLSDPKPGCLLDAQKASVYDQAVRGPVHISKTVLSVPPNNNIKNVVSKAIEGLMDGQETFSETDLQILEGEWVGHRSSVDKHAVEPESSETINYSALMQDVKSDTTILYFHGGQFYRRDPATHRSLTHQLAKSTGGRCLSLRYRLAPQNPFPAALIDGLVAYLSLLYPPGGSTQSAVPADKICFAGDSAGGNIVIALLQLILELRRQSTTDTEKLIWLGQERDIPLPAGVAVLSPYVDLTRGLDSEVVNLPYDVIPPRGPPFILYEPCSVWPASPPRHHVYANDNALLHPLVSPNTAQDWSGAPPVWICEGEECLADMATFVAQKMASQGVTVVLEQYSAMPHSFPLLFENLEASRHCMERWARFIQAAAQDPESIQTEALLWTGHPLVSRILDIKNLISISLADMKQRMSFQVRQWGPPPSLVGPHSDSNI